MYKSVFKSLPLIALVIIFFAGGGPVFSGEVTGKPKTGLAKQELKEKGLSIPDITINVNRGIKRFSVDSVESVTVVEQGFSSGITDCGTALYSMKASAGQPLAGMSGTSLYSMETGHWEEFDESCCLVAGDANHDGSCNLADAGFVINFIFYEGIPSVCTEEGDANSDGSVNLGDAGYVINYIFYDGPGPICL